MARPPKAINTPPITIELAKALGVSGCQRAVLTLEMGELPKLDVHYFALETHGPKPIPGDLAAKISRAPFKVRLYLHPTVN